MQIAIEQRSLMGSEYCGDQAGYWKTDDGVALCLVDGAGHGESAEKAARIAVEYVSSHLNDSLQDIFDGCNRAMLKTGGGAVALAFIEEQTRLLTYAGIGDTGAKIFRSHRMTSLFLPVQSGMMGKSSRTIHPLVEPMSRGDVIVMYTDGIERTLDLSAYSDDLFGNARRLAMKLVDEFGRLNDDRTVLVAQF